MPIKYLLACVTVLLLSGCAGQSKLTGQDSPRPSLVAADSAKFMGRTVDWGGTIIAAENRRDSTWVEILAVPVSVEGRPLVEKDSLGRFMAVKNGYLELADYAPGRLVTVRGVIREIRIGNVYEAEYKFPILEVNTLLLWPKKKASSETQFHFGVGIGIGF